MAEAGEQLAGAAVRGGRVQHAGGGVLVAEVDVLGDGEAVDDVELLVHGRDAHAERGDGGGDGGRLALPDDLAAVGLVRAGEDLDERRLARAVLPEDAVHLAGDDVEVDAAQGDDTRERLGDARHRQ